MKTFKRFLEEKEEPISKSHLDDLEKALDKVFGQLGMDIEFSKHFFDRVNDARNKTQITLRELAMLFRETYLKFGKEFAQIKHQTIEAVLADLRTHLNVPFHLGWNKAKKELELTAKTIMRKVDFKTPDRKYVVAEQQQ